MNPHSTSVPKLSPLLRIFRRMLTPFLASHGLGEGVERRLILPRGWTNGSTYHELDDLILARARRLHGGDVLVGNPCGLSGDLVDQRAERLGGARLRVGR